MSDSTSKVASNPALCAVPLELEQIVDHQPWLHEWQQVPTRKYVSFDAEPVSSDPALQADREETVVMAGWSANPDRRPRLEVTHRFKADVGLGPLIRLTFGRDVGVDIVEKIGSLIEGAIATGSGRLLLRVERASVYPPCLLYTSDAADE